MVVDDLYVVGVALFPAKTNTPPIIDPDAVLTLPIPLQRLQTVRWGHSQVPKCLGSIEHPQLPQSGPLNVCRQSANRLSLEERFGLFRPEGPDHRLTL